MRLYENINLARINQKTTIIHVVYLYLYCERE